MKRKFFISLGIIAIVVVASLNFSISSTLSLNIKSLQTVQATVPINSCKHITTQFCQSWTDAMGVIHYDYGFLNN